MSTLTVKNIETKTGSNDKGSWTNWIVTYGNNQKANTFDPELGRALAVGQVRDFQLEKGDKFTKILGYGPELEGGQTDAQNVTTTPDVPKEVWDAKDRAREMGFAFQAACTFYQGRDVDITLVDKLAQAVYKRVQMAKEGTPFA